MEKTPIQKAHDQAFSMLKEGLKLEWKKYVPNREKLSKKDDIAFVKKERQRLFEKRRGIDNLK